MLSLPHAIDSNSILLNALPHRAPMIWIDEVVEGSKDGGICRVRLQQDRLYCDESGTILKNAPIEWIAQAFGYSRAVFELQNNPDIKEPARTFLVGIRTFFLKPIPVEEVSLLIETKLFRELPPLALVDGWVRSEATGDEYAKVQLKLFFE